MGEVACVPARLGGQFEGTAPMNKTLLCKSCVVIAMLGALPARAQAQAGQGGQLGKPLSQQYNAPNPWAEDPGPPQPPPPPEPPRPVPPPAPYPPPPPAQPPGWPGQYPYRVRYPQLPPPPPRGREGMTVGFSLGVGAGRFDERGQPALSSGTVAGSFRIGGMLDPDRALLFHLDGWSFRDGSYNYQVGAMSVALQQFLADRVWIKAGAGLGFGEVTLRDGAYYDRHVADYPGLFGLVTVGIELVHTRNAFALDLETTVNGLWGKSLSAESGSIQLGFHWY